jgi:hypothetical protein
MKRPCQICGRPATYVAPKATRHHRIKSREDHDLCMRCFHKQMSAVNAAQKSELALEAKLYYTGL